jgi:hypothetical protein
MQRSIMSDLIVFLAVLGTCVVLISTAIFYAEKDGDHAELYPNIPASMWWTVITFTSVGYGDVFPGPLLHPLRYIARILVQTFSVLSFHKHSHKNMASQ